MNCNPSSGLLIQLFSLYNIDLSHIIDLFIEVVMLKQMFILQMNVLL